MFPKKDGPRTNQSLMCMHKEARENKERGKGKEKEVRDLEHSAEGRSGKAELR